MTSKLSSEMADKSDEALTVSPIQGKTKITGKNLTRMVTDECSKLWRWRLERALTASAEEENCCESYHSRS
jgi:hypothetical protein